MASVQRAGHGGSPAGRVRESRAGRGRGLAHQGGTRGGGAARRVRDHDGGGFVEIAAQALGRSGKQGGCVGNDEERLGPFYSGQGRAHQGEEGGNDRRWWWD
jgi:hypothetical protein